jgi:regulator of protease activity HflC (stomatin/prohibitin superfamily)
MPKGEEDEMPTILSILLVFAVWLLLGFRIIRENENAVVVFLGKPRRTATSGLIHTWWPFEYVKRFTTNLIELNFANAGLITVKDANYGEINIGLETNLYFRWPEDDALIQTVKVVAHPENTAFLTNLFEETVLDTFRTVGSSKTYREIMKDRKAFAEEVRTALLDEDADPVNQAGIPAETLRLTIKHVHLPPGFEETLSQPEIQRVKMVATGFEAQATKIKLEGEGKGLKKKHALEGEGIASARESLYKAIGTNKENLLKEALLTMREMAQGTSNTILFPIPSGLSDMLSETLGKKGVITDAVDLNKIIAGLSDDQLKLAMKLLQETLTSKTGGIQ